MSDSDRVPSAHSLSHPRQWPRRILDGVGEIRQRLADVRERLDGSSEDSLPHRAGGSGKGRTIAYELTRWDEGSAPLPRVLITALGEGETSKETLIRSTCAVASSEGSFPVVVATGLGVEFLVNSEFPIEQLPRRTDLGLLDDAEYRYYVQRRWRIILAKWRIAETIDLFDGFDEFVAQACAMKGRHLDAHSRRPNEASVFLSQDDME